MKDDSPIRTDVKTLIGIIVAVSAGVWAWANVKAEVASHTSHLQAIQSTITVDHDQLKVQGVLIQQQGFLLERMDKKLDYVTGASRTRPAATPPSQ